ncbi:MAG: hypothetical protein SAJ12_21415, partial [Jaaginema sp. PMC 1079.18]|nr:hypothetical protein [Jaaginema sp. PMC 1079.18]
DTSVLCVLLQIPEKDKCESGQKKGKKIDKTDLFYWDYPKITQRLEHEQAQGTVFVLPLAVVIETGNHITQISGSKRYDIAQKLTQIMQSAADETTPWAAFSQQVKLWSGEGLKALATDWQSLVNQEIALGDVTIKELAQYYAQIGFTVEILTGDAALKACEPPPPANIPKRRSAK